MIAYLRAGVWTCLGLLWLPVGVSLALLALPAAAVEPGVAFELAVSLSPMVQAGISWLLSSLSGVTALLLRIDAALSAAPDQPLPRPLLFCSAHMSGSWLAGVLAFLLAHGASPGNALQTFAVVIAASFTGAKFVEGAAERLFPRTSPAFPVPPIER